MALNAEYLKYSSIWEVLRYVVLFSGLLLACWQDIRYRRISKTLTIPIMICGLLLALPDGWLALQGRFIAVLLPFLLGLPLFALRILGAGDIKLLMALGALMGREWLLHCLLYTVFWGGILALLLMLKRGILLNRLSYFFSYCYKTLLLCRFTPYQAWDDDTKQGKQFFPFALAIALGSLSACIAYKFF